MLYQISHTSSSMTVNRLASSPHIVLTCHKTSSALSSSKSLPSCSCRSVRVPSCSTSSTKITGIPLVPTCVSKVFLTSSHPSSSWISSIVTPAFLFSEKEKSPKSRQRSSVRYCLRNATSCEDSLAIKHSSIPCFYLISWKNTKPR